MLKIGLVDFLNAYPLYYALEEHAQRGRSFELFYAVPSELSRQMQANQLDVSLVSSVECFRHSTIWNYFSQLGIASHGRVESIRFFMHPEHKFLQGEEIFPLEKVYLDYASKSSVELCKIILRSYKQIAPQFITVQPPHMQRIQNLQKDEALLLIGDQALVHRQLPSLDMGEWYYKLFKKPFVYALWVYRKNLTSAQQNELEQLFMDAFRTGQKQKDVMYKKAAQKFSFDVDYCRHYFDEVIHYELNEDFLAAMNFFFSQVKK